MEQCRRKDEVKESQIGFEEISGFWKEEEICGFWVERPKHVHTGIKMKQLSAEKKVKKRDGRLVIEEKM